MSIVQWDDIPGDDLAVAVGAGWACLRRVTLGPGESLHLDADDRETIVWALDRDAVLVRRPGDVERSVRAEGALDVLVFATDAPPPDPHAPPAPAGVIRPLDAEGERLVDGETSITRYEVGTRAGAVEVGLELVDVAPGRRSFPAGGAAEVSVVLRGTGRAVLGDEEAWVVRGSVVGRRERFIAGPQGLRVLSFRERRAG